MGKDAVTDYQQLGDRLDEAASNLKASRKRVGRKSRDIPGDMAGHPADPIPMPADHTDAATDVQAVEPSPASDRPDTAEEQDGVVTLSAQEASEAKATSKKDRQVDAVALEALLFSTRHPLTSARLAELIDIPSAKALKHAIAALNELYESSGRSFRIEQVAGGYQMLTMPSFGPLLNKMHQREIDAKLSRSALETLSIIAYKQPVLRAEVEAIRGVASGETIRSLMEKHLVKIAGRAEEPGRPILYGTTKRFLEVFGLNSLKELPKEDQARPARPAAPAPTSVDTPATETAAATPSEPSEPSIEQSSEQLAGHAAEPATQESGQ
jgi:segregation and condensation protein B